MEYVGGKVIGLVVMWCGWCNMSYVKIRNLRWVYIISVVFGDERDYEGDEC